MQGRSTTDWRLRTRTLTLGARTLVMGSPARVVREVGEEDLLERWRY